jgi:hypothetical protein
MTYWVRTGPGKGGVGSLEQRDVSYLDVYLRNILDDSCLQSLFYQLSQHEHLYPRLYQVRCCRFGSRRFQRRLHDHETLSHVMLPLSF